MTDELPMTGTTLTVRAPGLMSTLQDHGRFGMRSLGVPWSGAMTPVWQQLANALVGNSERHSIIECFEGGLKLHSGDAPLRMAVMAASDAKMHLESGNESKSIKPGRSYTVPPDTVFKLSSTGSFRHAVIAIQALESRDHLGSSSTYTKAGLGGIDGHALTAGDCLQTSATPQGLERECLDPLAKAYQANTLRVVLGPQDDHFSDSGIETFLATEYTLSAEVDRMGARLSGLPLQHRDAAARDIVSDAIVPGSVQVPGNGQPIVLLNDAHTAGGYPKIATVISIDLPLLGLQRTGSTYRFEAVSVEDAIAAVRRQAIDVQKAISQISTVKDFTLTTEILLSHNLIDGVTDGQMS
ncbi:biotin-dependent carboxyltransferase family protein [Granulosicoccus antarcticus]|uniref:KipI antagonist n=1 Tax=Granulosicoccus antarcticus IMCC3135 TaxID=1192854 RepID=A0A2Z2NYD4_9GAMM|nr:biotin-dependent carboxyltransferase family protein [Granulosicoccus antarcticus]ASJ74941.1 KipI antagonist [Granulosicoccus antarcticus IMCC3135]